MGERSDKQPEDLKTRTKAFALRIIRMYAALPKSGAAQVLGQQVLRSGTSVGAHYREASRARSDAEFISKIDQCAQEADESQLWLELLQDDCGIPAVKVQPVWQEANELIAIFVTMAKNTNKRLNQEI